MEEKKFGFKGFDKDLRCRGFQYEIGKTYEKLSERAPRLCTNEGFHYCNTIQETVAYYPIERNSRYCRVEILGPYNYSYDKGLTTKIKILEEVTHTNEVIVKAKMEIEQKYIEETEEKLHLELLRKIQEKYPLMHVGGSVGLYLHGIKLKRFETWDIDLDLVHPHFVRMEEINDDETTAAVTNLKNGSNNFDHSVKIHSKNCEDCRVDLKIDPKQIYEIVEYKNYKYKVSPILTILEAKVRYAMEGNVKHKQDIEEMLGIGYGVQ